MKKLLYILFVCCCGAAAADDLTTQQGTVYRNVVIISADPAQMLIVHDGGGCQVKYTELAPNSLTAAQRRVIEEKLTYFVEKKQRAEKAAAEKKAFETAQLEKGLIEFEGAWMKPLEKEELLQRREQRRLEVERQRIQLAKERAQLEKEQLETDRARYLLEGNTSGSSTISVGYFPSYHRSGGTWYPYSHGRGCSDKSGYSPSLYTRHNFRCPPNRGNRVYINAGRPLSYSSGVLR